MDLLDDDDDDDDDNDADDDVGKDCQRSDGEGVCLLEVWLMIG